jgi:hypothetical protein
MTTDSNTTQKTKQTEVLVKKLGQRRAATAALLNLFGGRGARAQGDLEEEQQQQQ